MSWYGMLNALFITALQDRTTIDWHGPGPSASPDDNAEQPSYAELSALIEAQHRANFYLWHEEDKARDPVATDSTITAVKHAIDRISHRRNDMVEEIDALLLTK